MIGTIRFYSPMKWEYHIDPEAKGTRRHLLRISKATHFPQFAGVAKDEHEGFCLSCKRAPEHRYDCQNCYIYDEFYKACPEAMTVFIGQTKIKDWIKKFRTKRK